MKYQIFCFISLMFNMQVGQVDEVVKYFNGKKNGVFVEAGAFDGEFLSNTLLLEVDFCMNENKVEIKIKV